MPTRKLILIDFDGTITKKDSFIEFIKFNTNTSFFYLTGYLTYLIFIIHKLGFYDAKKAKELILSFYFKGKSKETLEQMAQKFTEHLFQKKEFRETLIQYIKDEKTKNARIVVVTASPGLWVKPFCDNFTIELIASELHYENELFTGKFSTPNCNGEEKSIRIQATIDLGAYNEIEVHGNSKGDIPMMRLGHKIVWY